MEQWKDDVLKSMQGAQRAQPDPQLYAAIQAKIVGIGAMQVVKRPYLALAAASLALLITANISLLASRSAETSTPSVYQIENANFSIYQ